MENFEFDDKVKHVDSSFSGKVKGLCQYKSGVKMALIVGDLLDSNNKPVELWFDYSELEIVK